FALSSIALAMGSVMALAGEYRMIASPEEFAEVIQGLLYPQRPENVAFTLRQRLLRNLVPLE
ncbi:hypothetical protein, partial [Klebsiella aerogenes]|uniref:hypothetical protein n=1 Tax=Klebsiella aerogenes TaxID=548 RepID=UPI001954A96A